MSKPIIAIVGRPNVGKSTLFNKLIGERRSIVEDTPGVTRDRIYGETEWRGRKLVLIDTGGIEPKTDDVILSQMKLQAQVAIDTADVIVFLCDVRAGLTAADRDIAVMLKKSGKPIVLATNKCDSVGGAPMEYYEFYELGFDHDPIQLSSLHGSGSGDLLDACLDALGDWQDEEETDDSIRVAVIGKPNAGKSSLLNRLLDYDKAIVSSVAGTTRDAVEGEIDIDGVKFIFSDTAGIRESDDEIENAGIERSLKILNSADVCLVVLDGSVKTDADDKKILAETENRERIVVINKTDLGTNCDVKGDVSISAKNGDGIDELKKSLVEKAFGGEIDLGADFLTEERHLVALKEALDSVNDAVESFSVNTADLSSIDIRNAWLAFGEISGETADEAIIDEIFAKFCVGK